jgi:two-component system chemotaxis response regulator CheB
MRPKLLPAIRQNNRLVGPSSATSQETPPARQPLTCGEDASDGVFTGLDGMPKRDIIVIGASAGGLSPLIEIVNALPRGFPAALFVVLHVSPWHKSELPSILGRSGKLLAMHPGVGERVRNGYIYVAPPDYHLLLENDEVQLWRGPRENLHRPAINPLFRSAAVSYGNRVAGVILSGASDDGSTGLWWVKNFGGATLVQTPDEAQFADMPRSALDTVAVDFVANAEELGTLLVGLAAGDEVQAGVPEDREAV